MKNMSLATIKHNVIALKDFSKDDLAVQERVDSLVETAKNINTAAKEYKAQDEELKNQLKRIVRDYTDNGNGVTAYSYVNEAKIAISVVGGDAEITEASLLDALYKQYGEQPGSKDGHAWRAYISLTDEVPAVRVINEQRLEAALTAAKAGNEGALPTEVFANATKVKKPSIKAVISNMSKDEKKAHDDGDLNETFVIK